MVRPAAASLHSGQKGSIVCKSSYKRVLTALVHMNILHRDMMDSVLQ